VQFTIEVKSLLQMLCATSDEGDNNCFIKYHCATANIDSFLSLLHLVNLSESICCWLAIEKAV